MALSYVSYTADGLTDNFNVTFDYLAKAHVTVTVNDVSAAFTWVSTSVVNITAGVVDGDVVVIRRTTPKVSLANSNDGSVLTNSILQTLARQNIFLSEEAFDSADDALAVTNGAVADVTAFVDDASGFADAASASAASAAAQASVASGHASSAGSAKTLAEAAQAAAEVAQGAAEAAQAAAELAAGSLDPSSNIAYSGNNTHSGSEDFTGTVSVKDANFSIKDDADPTKVVKIEAAGVTTGTTRTLTVPDENITLAGRANAETLSNKTLASPVVSGGLTWPDGVVQSEASMLLGAINAQPPIINGCMRVAQRAAPSLTTTAAYGAIDRMACWASGGAVGAGTVTQNTASGIGRTGYSLKLSGVTLTGSGQLSVRYRMEAKDAMRFKNQTASFGLLCSHDAGSTINYEIHVRTPTTTADTFSSVTAINNTTVAVATGISTPTTVKIENVSLGDVSKGLEIEVKVPCGAITTKNFEFAEFRMNAGAALAAFNYVEDMTTTLTRCQRYYEVGNIGLSSSYVPYAGWAMYGWSEFRAIKRVAPTIGITGAAYWTSNVYGAGAYNNVASAPDGSVPAFSASAEL
jgi:hypothetical protein